MDPTALACPNCGLRRITTSPVVASEAANRAVSGASAPTPRSATSASLELGEGTDPTPSPQAVAAALQGDDSPDFPPESAPASDGADLADRVPVGEEWTDRIPGGGTDLTSVSPSTLNAWLAAATENGHRAAHASVSDSGVSGVSGSGVSGSDISGSDGSGVSGSGVSGSGVSGSGVSGSGVSGSGISGSGVGSGLSSALTKTRGRFVSVVIVGIIVVAILLGAAVAIVVNRLTAPPPATPTPSVAGLTADQQTMLQDKYASGLVTVVATTCTGLGWGGHGSGFLIAPDRVATSWTTVADGMAFAVTQGFAKTISATVDRADPVAGIAILRLSQPLPGHVFEVGSGELAEGQINYLARYDFIQGVQPTFFEAMMRGINQQGTQAGLTTSGLGLSGVAASSIRAGGPWLDANGVVQGVTARYNDNPTLLMVKPAQVTAVNQSTSTFTAGNCANPKGPLDGQRFGGETNPVMAAYFLSINAGDYPAALNLMVPALKTNPTEITRRWSTGYFFNISLVARPGGVVRASYEGVFTVGHGARPDQTCGNWVQDFTIANGQIVGIRDVSQPVGC